MTANASRELRRDSDVSSTAGVGQGGDAVNLRVEVKNAILGDSIFWEGQAERLEEIRNIPARELARQVATDGQTRKSGMWVVSALPNRAICIKTEAYQRDANTIILEK